MDLNSWGSVYTKLKPKPQTSLPYFTILKILTLSSNNSLSTLIGCELVDQLFKPFKIVKRDKE